MSERAEYIAYEINGALPESYRRDIELERLRLENDVLKPRHLRERKVLIVGGAGYIGTIITKHLLARGYLVRSFDRLIYNHGLTILPHLSHPSFEFMWGDLTNKDDFDRALDKGVTDVILLAGLVGDPITQKYPSLSHQINEAGHELMLSCLTKANIERLIFVSTCSNYGLIEDDKLADEDFKMNPLSLYAKSKVHVEQALLNMKDANRFSSTILRFSTAFGLSPRMRFDLTVNEFTRTLFLGEELLVYDAHTWRPYCHVQDFAEVIRRVLEAPAERVRGCVFNAGGDVNNFTKQMIVDAVLSQQADARVKYEKSGGDPRNYRVDFQRIRKTLYFEPEWTIPDGIRELIDAMKQGLFHDISSLENFHGNWAVEKVCS